MMALFLFFVNNLQYDVGTTKQEKPNGKLGTTHFETNWGGMAVYASQGQTCLIFAVLMRRKTKMFIGYCSIIDHACDGVAVTLRLIRSTGFVERINAFSCSADCSFAFIICAS